MDSLNASSGDVGDVQQTADSGSFQANKGAKLLYAAHLTPHEGPQVDGLQLSVLVCPFHGEYDLLEVGVDFYDGDLCFRALHLLHVLYSTVRFVVCALSTYSFPPSLTHSHVHAVHYLLTQSLMGLQQCM